MPPFSVFFLVLVLVGCQIPDEPDIERHGTAAVTVSGFGRIVLACPAPAPIVAPARH